MRSLWGIVSDSGANVKKARQRLCPTDSEDCLPHKLHNAVFHVVNKSEEGGRHASFNETIYKDLTAIQSWFVWIRASEGRIHQLEKSMPDGVKFKMPLLGNATRWWGKHKMLERFLYLKKALEMTAETNGLDSLKEMLSAPDDFLQKKFWMRITCYNDIFSVLNKLSVKSQAEKKETRSRLVTWIEKCMEDRGWMGSS